MGKTSIEWTDASWNPIVGCTEISPGCANCYAARLAATRLKHHPDYQGLAVIHQDRYVSADKPKVNCSHWEHDVHVRLLPERLEEPVHWRKPRRIFVCDMGDLFHESAPSYFIAQVFRMMSRCKQHTFQVLTKRADRMHSFCSRVKSSLGFHTHNGNPPRGYGGDANAAPFSVRPVRAWTAGKTPRILRTWFVASAAPIGAIDGNTDVFRHSLS
jgi:protein gp37